MSLSIISHRDSFGNIVSYLPLKDYASLAQINPSYSREIALVYHRTVTVHQENIKLLIQLLRHSTDRTHVSMIQDQEIGNDFSTSRRIVGLIMNLSKSVVLKITFTNHITQNESVFGIVQAIHVLKTAVTQPRHLYYAIRSNNVKSLHAILSLNAYDINTSIYLLTDEVRSGEAAQILQEHYHFNDNILYEAFINAIKRNQIGVVEYFLNSALPLDKNDVKTALKLAVNKPKILTLLQQHFFITEVDDYMANLFSAIADNRLDVIREILHSNPKLSEENLKELREAAIHNPAIQKLLKRYSAQSGCNCTLS